MAHVSLSNNLPGIAGLLAAYPATGRHLSGLAEELLRAPSILTPFERELIAVVVSRGNTCVFCSKSHAAAACGLDPEGAELVRQVADDFRTALVSDLLRSLMVIADKVREAAKSVTSEDIELARSLGANDDVIQQTVLIAAAFCMYNRYVDGLATFQPANDEAYVSMGRRLAAEGYMGVRPTE